MPNLDNLRKQAKQLVRWHRERHYPVAAQIRRYLPECAGLTDPEILDRPFSLAEAQRLLAIRAGLTEWSDLMAACHSEVKMADATPVVLGAEPQLFTRDMSAAIDFYTRHLGFGLAFTYGEPPFYAQVRRGGARLNLRLVHEAVTDVERCREGDLLAATVTVSGIKRIFLEFLTEGVEFAQSLRTEPWGSRTFIVLDPDGNRLLFAE